VVCVYVLLLGEPKLGRWLSEPIGAVTWWEETRRILESEFKVRNVEPLAAYDDERRL